VNDIEILVTETGPGSSGGVVPFLFAVDDYLTWFENGASTVDYQDLHQGYLASPGDPGNTSGSYLNPYGPWYGVSLSSTVARVGDNMVAATSSNSLLRAHAVQRTDGQTGVILVNEDPGNSTAVTVSISGVKLSSAGTQYNFGNANFSSGSDTANSGIVASPISGVGNSFTITVPAYSATAVVIPLSTTSSFLLTSGGSINLVAGATTGNTSTITVSPSNGFTGTVGLTCAVTSPSGAASPATCSLASSSVASGSGTDVLTVATTSTTTAGVYSVTITGTSASITQTTTVTVNVTAAPTPSFALTNSGTITVSPGATTGNTSTTSVTPSGGFTGAVAMSCAISSSPAGAVDLPTCSLASASVTISGTTAQTDVVTVTTTAATTAFNKPANSLWPSSGGAALALAVVLVIPARRRKGLSMLGLLVFSVSIAAIGCSSGSSGGGGGPQNPGTTAGAYSITVTGTPTSGTAETTVVTLTVN
jgi:trimeric autotransporter adhesin